MRYGDRLKIIISSLIASYLLINIHLKRKLDLGIIGKDAAAFMLFLYIANIIIYMGTPSLEYVSSVYNYKDIKSTINTGDIIFFNSNHLNLMYVKLVSGCPIDHCGMAFRDSVNNKGGKIFNKLSKEDELYVLEAEVDSSYDMIRMKDRITGVVMSPLEDKMNNESYEYPMCLVRLNKHDIKDVDFLKLDTQGSELDITSGCMTIYLEMNIRIIPVLMTRCFVLSLYLIYIKNWE